MHSIQHKHTHTVCYDVESATARPPRTTVSCLPRLALVRRKKWLALLPLLALLALLYLVTTHTVRSGDKSLFDPLHQVSASMNAIAAKLRLRPHGEPNLDMHAHLHTHAPHQAHKFSSKDESILLLLLALQSNAYVVEDDWRQVYVERTPLEAGGLFATLNVAPTNRFTQLLSQLALPKPHTKRGSNRRASILDDAYQLYSLSREEWVERVRSRLGVTVFSKSYCPYSNSAKRLLDSMNATYTVYEVDERSDARNLHQVVAELTAHTTFPTILVRESLLGGWDDLVEYARIGALSSVLQSVRAVRVDA